ncbi:hypothetical protein TUBRATIS_27720 [Tubulinosema ratisbonensis]|uniref:Uncharacterized protein n=1 Tax=Tubulinosema ratisbonensis TaxID=291195 RepID=A0A437AHZ7_9MICR|nr:hypothetical protein TUBRATIS_27720 [Tubulinosema ratisbonensis]
MLKYKFNELGKIIQLLTFSEQYLTKNPLIIQTYGIKQNDYICCANTHKIKEIILSNLDKDSLIIFDFSTLIETTTLVYTFRLVNCLGKNVYLVTSKREKLWFVNEFIKN